MAGSAPARPSSHAELAIVGAGPVGLYACYYAGFRGLEAVVVEALPFVGGQIAAFYADAEIFDVAGHPRIRGRDLCADLERQARQFGATLHLGRRVTAIEREADRLRLHLRSGASDPPTDLVADAVLLTAGIGPFSPQRIADPAIDRFEGRGLQYEEPDLGALAGRRVLVLGGAGLALEAAKACARHGAIATLVHRRERLSGLPDDAASLDGSSVTFLPFRDLAALEGEDRVRTAVLLDRRSGERERIEVDLVLPRFGVAAHGEALRELGCDPGETIAVDTRMATPRPGIWAAGDVATYPGKVKVLASAFGEACTAVNNIAHQLIPGASVFPGYSSHRRGVPARRRSREGPKTSEA